MIHERDPLEVIESLIAHNAKLHTIIQAYERARANEGPASPAELGWEPPEVLPPLWRLKDRATDGASYVNRTQNLVVILSVAMEHDGRRWVHLSCSHSKRVPTWRELREVKDIFIGTQRHALQVLPPESQYVNIHPNVLHLWHCLDEVPLPDFTRGGRSL